MRAIQILLALILLVLAAEYFPDFTRMVFVAVAVVAIAAVAIGIGLVAVQIAAAAILIPIAFIANAAGDAPAAIARLWRRRKEAEPPN